MRPRIGIPARIGAGHGVVDVSHGKEKLNDGRMTEAPEWTICAHLNYSAGQPGQRKYSALGAALRYVGWQTW